MTQSPHDETSMSMSDQESPGESHMRLEEDTHEASPASLEWTRSPPSVHKHQDDQDFLQLSASLSALLKDKLADENSRVRSESTVQCPVRQLARHLWQADEMASSCSIVSCSSLFNRMNRRHHCRLCGRVVCQACSGGTVRIFLPFC